MSVQPRLRSGGIVEPQSLAQSSGPVIFVLANQFENSHYPRKSTNTRRTWSADTEFSLGADPSDNGYQRA